MTIRSKFSPALLAAWAKQTGCNPDDERVQHPDECGWPGDFAHFRAGWDAAMKAAALDIDDLALCEGCGEACVKSVENGAYPPRWCHGCYDLLIAQAVTRIKEMK